VERALELDDVAKCDHSSIEAPRWKRQSAAAASNLSHTAGLYFHRTGRRWPVTFDPSDGAGDGGFSLEAWRSAKEAGSGAETTAEAAAADNANTTSTTAAAATASSAASATSTPKASTAAKTATPPDKDCEEDYEMMADMVQAIDTVANAQEHKQNVVAASQQLGL